MIYTDGVFWFRETDSEQHGPYADKEQAQRDCPHTSYTQDRVTGECTCDDCEMLLIDSIGRVLT